MSEPTPPPYGPPPGPPPEYAPYMSPQSPPEASRRRRKVTVAIAGLAAVAAVAAAVAIPLVSDEDDRVVGGGNGRTDLGGSDRAGVNLDDVEFIEKLNTTHIEKEVDYDESPPVGGPHNPVWLDCGVYDEPVPNENVVHDLEHGTVWITYRTGLDQDGIDALAGALPQNGILSPYDDLQAPVVVTVWGTRLKLDGVDDPRLPLFIARFGAGETAPEPMASCAGGLREPPALQGAGTAV